MTTFQRAVRAEWTKLRTVRSTGWVAVVLVASTITMGAMTMYSANTENCLTPAIGCDEDLPLLSLTGVYVGQIIVVAFAALAMTTEYGTRLIHTTLATQPRRGTVLMAKATVVTTIVLGGGVLGVLGSVALARWMLPGNGFTVANGYALLSLSDGTTLRAAAGTMLYLGLVGLLALGLGTIIRDTAWTLTTILGLLLLAPMIAEIMTDEQWRRNLLRAAPMTAGLAIMATKRLDTLPIGPWPGLGVLAAYAGGAMAIGYVLFRLRDA